MSSPLRTTHQYDDILSLSRPASSRPKMSRHDRAAQFSPFAALTGYDAVIEETARLTEPERESSEYLQECLSQRLNEFSALPAPRPEVSLTCFQPDAFKEGGAYITLHGHVRRVDSLNLCVVWEDGTLIPFRFISNLDWDGCSPPENDSM